MLWLLFLLALTAFTSGTSAAGLPEITLTEADFTVTPNVLTLSRWAIEQNSPFSPKSRVVNNNLNTDDFNVSKIAKSEYLVANITIGNQNFGLTLDTGAADTWVADRYFQCYDAKSHIQINQSECDIAELLLPSPTYQIFTDFNLNITYGDGEFLLGLAAVDQVTMAGITVPEQIIGVVQYAAWSGVGYTSGILGLAYPGCSRFFSGLDWAGDVSDEAIAYNTVFASMCKQGSINPLLSFAINRPTPGLAAGHMSLGGIPPVNFSSPMVSAGIVPYGCLNTGLGEYAINVKNVVYEINGSPGGTAVAPTNLTTFVPVLDTGTNGFYLPELEAIAINALFQPAAQWDPIYGGWWVNCSAIPPQIGFNISNEVFYMNQQDLIVDNQDGTCVSAVRIGAPNGYILGVQFFMNTLVVFDIGSGLVLLASRQHY